MSNKNQKNENIWEKFVLCLTRIMFRPKVEFENKSIQDINLKEPMVIICNHTCKENKHRLSEADGPIIREIFKNKKVCSLAAKDIMEKFPWNILMKGLKCIPVDRGGLSLGWVRDCEAELKNGNSVIIFPEGTTLKDEIIDEFHGGFVTLAKKANVKVLPVVIHRTFGFLNRKTRVRVGLPYELTDEPMTKDVRLRETERFKRIIVDMYCKVSGKTAAEVCCKRETEIFADDVASYKKAKI